jgi:hypothetical protein
MGQFWRAINRDLWPRRYTAWLTAIITLPFAGVQTYGLLDSRFPIRTADWLWVAFYWWVALSSLIEATTGVFSKALRRRYSKRREAGLCGKCGYDLRAATSVTCPECGAWHGTTPSKRFGRTTSES